MKASATATARSNIALVKYWGKRDAVLNLPATGSISVTLDRLTTRTTVAFDDALEADEIVLDGAPAVAAGGERVVRFLDLVRQVSGRPVHAVVRSENDFPTGAGLASSASGFAALALACDAALGLGLEPAALSALARRGSGSAARSLFGGFVEMHAGEAADGSDAFAEPLAAATHLPLRILVAITASGSKPVGSTEGMRRTAATSPYYEAWVAATQRDLDAMRSAIRDADIGRVGALAEGNCLRMHAAMLGADPPLLYWHPATLEVMHCVWDLRSQGVPAWFTIDAGPQVKVLCAPGNAAAVRERLAGLPGTREVLEAAPGPGAGLAEGAVA